MTKQLFDTYKACETVAVPATDLVQGDIVWLNRKVRGLGGADTLILVVSEKAHEDGGLAVFDHVTLWPVERAGKWNCVTSKYATLEKVVLPS